MKTTRMGSIGPGNGRANDTRSRGAVPVPKNNAGGRAVMLNASDAARRTVFMSISMWLSKSEQMPPALMRQATTSCVQRRVDSCRARSKYSSPGLGLLPGLPGADANTRARTTLCRLPAARLLLACQVHCVTRSSSKSSICSRSSVPLPTRECRRLNTKLRVRAVKVRRVVRA